MTAYLVEYQTFTAYCQDTENHLVEIYAENEEHAKDQVESRYTGMIVVKFTDIVKL